jgi:hypothetical protein
VSEKRQIIGHKLRAGRDLWLTLGPLTGERPLSELAPSPTGPKRMLCGRPYLEAKHAHTRYSLAYAIYLNEIMNRVYRLKSNRF